VLEGRAYEEAKEPLLNLNTEQLWDSVEPAEALGYRQGELGNSTEGRVHQYFAVGSM